MAPGGLRGAVPQRASPRTIRPAVVAGFTLRSFGLCSLCLHLVQA